MTANALSHFIKTSQVKEKTFLAKNFQIFYWL